MYDAQMVNYLNKNQTWKDMIHDVIAICDFGLMKLGRFADRDAFFLNFEQKLISFEF